MHNSALRDLQLALKSNIRLRHSGTGVSAEFKLSEGTGKTFEFGRVETRSGPSRELTETESDQLFNETVTYWRNWVSKCAYRGRRREMVNRSALVLKLLAYEPTRAIVAAATCSLPENIGGVRNWDYRYTWIRYAAFTVYSLMRLGYTEEAMRFGSYLGARCRELAPEGSLQTVLRY